MNLVTKLGTALYETHGQLCQELINAGYDLDNYYDGSKHWGEFDRVICMVAFVRGAKTYQEYLELFGSLKVLGSDDQMVSQKLFARLTGIKTPARTQTERTRNYRANQSAELQELRALLWINDNPVAAIEYIRNKFSNLL